MVTGCIVPGCKSQYKPSLPKDSDGNRVTLFRFPLGNDDLIRKWLVNIPRLKNYVPKKSSRICSLHFAKHDMVHIRKDSNAQRAKNLPENAERVRKKLHGHAIPCHFPSLPKYFSKNETLPRSGLAFSTKRWENEQKQHEKRIEIFFAADEIKSFAHLCKETGKIRIPKEFHLLIMEDRIMFMKFRTNVDDCLEIRTYLAIEDDLSFAMCNNGYRTPKRWVDHLVKDQFKTFTAISNVLALINDLKDADIRFDGNKALKFLTEKFILHSSTNLLLQL